MRRLTFSERAHNPGVPFRFPITTAEHEHDNFLLMKMREAYVEKVRGKLELMFRDRWYLFTEKEYIEAAERYYDDQDCLDNVPYSIQKECCAGYVSPITYINRHGDMTTRFKVRFDATPIDSLNNSLYFGLFSAREIKRARERVEDHIITTPSWLIRLCEWFVRRFCD